MRRLKGKSLPWCFFDMTGRDEWSMCSQVPKLAVLFKSESLSPVVTGPDAAFFHVVSGWVPIFRPTVGQSGVPCPMLGLV